MNAVSPSRAGLSRRHIGGTMSALRSTLCRSSAQQTLLALARQLDQAVAAGDDTDRSYLEAVAGALKCNVEKGFVTVVTRRLAEAEQNALRDAWTGCAGHESPLDGPAVDAWGAKDEAARQLLELIEGVGAPS